MLDAGDDGKNVQQATSLLFAKQTVGTGGPPNTYSSEDLRAELLSGSKNMPKHMVTLQDLLAKVAPQAVHGQTTIAQRLKEGLLCPNPACGLVWHPAILQSDIKAWKCEFKESMLHG